MKAKIYKEGVVDVCFCVFEINVCQTVHLREKYIQILEDRETLGLIIYVFLWYYH